MFGMIIGQDHIVLKAKSPVMNIGILCFPMAAMCVFCVIQMFPFPEDYSASDVFGVIFLCFLAPALLATGVAVVNAGFAKITIDGNGIGRKTILTKRNLRWDEVADWGISYSGRTKAGVDVYYLYFSDHVCEIKNERKKKLKGKMIRFLVDENDYYSIVDQAIPFCKDKTDVPPFVGEDQRHLV